MIANPEMRGVGWHSICTQYLQKLLRERQKPQATGEQSFHNFLKELLEQANNALAAGVTVTHEPHRTQHGRPDFSVERNGLTIGYVEAEDIGADLDNLQGQAKQQNERFRKELDNFLLTNFWDFRLFVKGEQVTSAQLPKPEGSSIEVSEKQTEKLKALLQQFFGWTGLQITKAEELAIHLAGRAQLLREVTLDCLLGSSKALSAARDALRSRLLPDLSNEQFADLFAQTAAYGLFAARCYSRGSPEPFTRVHATSFIPGTNPFLQRLFYEMVARPDLDRKVALVADDIAKLLAQADMEAILRDFGAKFSKEDPVVHFYETFLSKYNPIERRIRGVYYTPDPVVSFIVRSVHILLTERFGMRKGLADERALVLDPACGTGTFLSWVVRIVHDCIKSNSMAGVWNNYVKERLLPRVFGFELLMAPYVIAHLKLTLQLRETGYELQDDDRLCIYLTNSLETPDVDSQQLALEGFNRFITEEAKRAAEIKREKPILVVMANPPYSAVSANASYRNENGKKVPTWIGRLLEDYKKVNGVSLGEKNPKWLHDDYVKFIRFAQWRIEQTGKGIIGFITNHAWLDNRTFRGMRWNLLNTFSEIYVLNLHGNVRKQEKAPDGSKDENVFDIQQGVAILLAVKNGRQGQWEGQPRQCRVYYKDLWGTRDQKSKILAEKDVKTIDGWVSLSPQGPTYRFVPEDAELKKKYEQGFMVTDIFRVHGPGIVTARDKLTIKFTEEEVWSTVSKFIRLEENEARKEFNLGDDAEDWRVADAQKDLREAGVPTETAKQHLAKVLYRPFDLRFTFYTGRSKGFHCRPRQEIMKHLQGGDNWALVFMSRVAQDVPFTHCGVSKWLVDGHVFRDVAGATTSVAPLYLDETPTHKGGGTGDTAIPQLGVSREANFKGQFVDTLAKKLRLPQNRPGELPEEVAPEDIFGYIYAVLSSQKYRQRYSRFLRADVPRVPLTDDLDLFRKLAGLGKQLAKIHLLEDVPDLGYGQFPSPGDCKVDKVGYDRAKHRVVINKSQGFENVPPHVWNFCIGGRQPAKDWLDARRKRLLNLKDIEHYRHTLNAIGETLRLVGKIDSNIDSLL